MYKVKDVCKLSGVSARTLRYYDSIGLLTPDEVADTGYRYYSDENLVRLREIMLLKELDFSLDEIGWLIESPTSDKKRIYSLQKQIIREKAKRLESIIGLLDSLLGEGDEFMKGEKKDMFKAFDYSEIEKHQKMYEHEVKEKYGNSDAYRQSAQKTEKYSKEDMKIIIEKGGRIFTDISKLMDRNPDDKEVQGLVQEWRDHISSSFYECTIDIFAGLGQMYVVDDRFTENIDKIKPGLASYLSRAIEIYCGRNEK